MGCPTYFSWTLGTILGCPKCVFWTLGSILGSQNTRDKLRILHILGHRSGLEVSQDYPRMLASLTLGTIPGCLMYPGTLGTILGCPKCVFWTLGSILGSQNTRDKLRILHILGHRSGSEVSQDYPRMLASLTLGTILGCLMYPGTLGTILGCPKCIFWTLRSILGSQNTRDKLRILHIPGHRSGSEVSQDYPRMLASLTLGTIPGCLMYPGTLGTILGCLMYSGTLGTILGCLMCIYPVLWNLV